MTQVEIGKSARDTVLKFMERMFDYVRNLFPMLDHWTFRQVDREAVANATYLRDFIKSMIDQRREAMANSKEVFDKGDFISILLEDELFKNDDNIMVDECFTFMGGTTQPTAINLGNILFRLTQYPEIKAKVREEMQMLLSNSTEDQDWRSKLTYEYISDLRYMTMVINESLRNDPPIELSAMHTVTSDVELGEFKIKKDA